MQGPRGHQLETAQGDSESRLLLQIKLNLVAQDLRAVAGRRKKGHALGSGAQLWEAKVQTKGERQGPVGAAGVTGKAEHQCAGTSAPQALDSGRGLRGIPGNSEPKMGKQGTEAALGV